MYHPIFLGWEQGQMLIYPRPTSNSETKDPCILILLPPPPGYVPLCPAYGAIETKSCALSELSKYWAPPSSTVILFGPRIYLFLWCWYWTIDPIHARQMLYCWAPSQPLWGSVTAGTVEGQAGVMECTTPSPKPKPTAVSLRPKSKKRKENPVKLFILTEHH